MDLLVETEFHGGIGSFLQYKRPLRGQDCGAFVFDDRAFLQRKSALLKV